MHYYQIKRTTISQTTCCHYTNKTKPQQPTHPAQPDTKQHLIPSSNHPLIHSSPHPLIPSSTHPLIHSSTHPLIHSSTHLLIHSSAHPLIPPTILLLHRQPFYSTVNSPPPPSTLLPHRQLSSPTSPIALQLPIFSSHCASILLLPYSYRVLTRTSRTSRKMLQKLHQTTTAKSTSTVLHSLRPKPPELSHAPSSHSGGKLQGMTT